MSEPIRKQNKIIFLKLNDKKISNYSDINIDQLQKDLIEQKEMNYSYYTLIVYYPN